MSALDPRRQGRVVVRFLRGGKIGHLIVADEVWGAVEWSEKHGVWCIEDAQGRCLRHASSIVGKAAAKAEAVALAEQMVRDGTMPTPEEARHRRREHAKREREKRAHRPSEIRRAHERAEAHRLTSAECSARSEEWRARPFYEVFAEAFDLADPNLWRSNSFAMVRPRLLIEVRAAVAKLESKVHRQRIEARVRNRWQQYYQRALPETERKLARVREIMALLDDGGAP